MVTGVTVSEQQDTRASATDGSESTAVVDEVGALFSSVTAPPAPSSYSVSDDEWSNCRDTDLVQIVDHQLHITQHSALTELLVIRTAADINSGTLFMNSTIRVVGSNESFTSREVFGLGRWEVENKRLPWRASGIAVPLAGTVNVAGQPSSHRDSVYHLYDHNMREVGCLYDSATLTAPSSFSSFSSSNDNTIIQSVDNIAAANEQMVS